ncbi:Na+/H+ antiporter subunit B [Chitinophaga sedimenti]|uniref:Na+/H+ antiporter subunit B n=1 Tax=Chitinophaga sedimenti TaxID=2033606 RepID=UPI002003AD3E|nr:Na+/H+ antiporter subunit B [Chitinophaga sedimenti]MCK7558430.1 Na+/H+ antiporter subunit B [Chitinophaga sedimenti]
MRSIILKTASNYLLPLLLLFSVFILLRGHYRPGGGFVGGLIASIAFVLHAFANGLKDTRKLLRFPPGGFIPVGLSLALGSGLVPMFMGKPFMSAEWLSMQVPIVGSIGTPLFFDIGVFFVVIGITLTILFTISDSIL